MPRTSTRELVAHNTATRSDNKIHDDAVARRFGFGGGLVPGVDLYAYLAHAPAATWGTDWLQRGTMRARFLQPVYDGEPLAVQATEHTDADTPALTLELRDRTGTICARGEATLPDHAATDPDPAHWPAVTQALTPPSAAPEVLTPGTAFGLTPHRFVADRAPEYLAEVRETLELYGRHRVAHPGWLLRDANYVLAGNVVLGPWIHVGSVVQHHRPVRDGDVVGARALIEREWEHKGHRFVELDVALLAGGDVAARVAHTAIYRPRQVSG